MRKIGVLEQTVPIVSFEEVCCAENFWKKQHNSGSEAKTPGISQCCMSADTAPLALLRKFLFRSPCIYPRLCRAVLMLVFCCIVTKVTMYAHALLRSDSESSVSPQTQSADKTGPDHGTTFN